MMRIRTSHRLGFESPQGALFVSAGGNTEENAPEWIAEEGLFVAAKAAGQLTVLEESAPQAVLTSEPEVVEFLADPVDLPEAPEQEAQADSEPEAPEAEKPKRGRKPKTESLTEPEAPEQDEPTEEAQAE